MWARARGDVGRRDVLVWVLVESCRDCHMHSAYVRHDESAYNGRIKHLRDALRRDVPGGVEVELLVPQGVRGESFPRIGAFEVYLCGSDAMVHPCGNPLRFNVTKSGLERPSGYVGCCVASKLRTRNWLPTKVLMSRICAAMPRLQLRISIRTELDVVVPGVNVAVTASAVSRRPPLPDARGGAAAHETTGKDGSCTLFVPAGLQLRVRAWHGVLMAPQETELRVTEFGRSEAFVVETVVQFMQAVQQKELIVYCCSPAVGVLDETKQMQPFAGTLECTSGATLKPDTFGNIRGRGDPLQDVDLACCPGWRFSRFEGKDVTMQISSGRVVEIAKLGAPILQLCFVSACCGMRLPGARISIDDEDFGEVPLGFDSTLECSVRCGDHTLVAHHALTAPDGSKMPLPISGDPTTRTVMVPLPLERLRFVCSAAAGTRSDGGLAVTSVTADGAFAGKVSIGGASGVGIVPSAAVADLWLVGGDLAMWREGYGAPTKDAEVWLWDGEFGQGTRSGSSGSPPLRVQAGVLNTTSIARLQHQAVQDGVDSNSCELSKALTTPLSSQGPWRVALQPASTPDTCNIVKLAGMPDSAAHAIWLAKLVAEAPRIGRHLTPPHFQICTLCCGRGLQGKLVEVDGSPVGRTDENGYLDLSHLAEASWQRHISAPLRIRVADVPPNLLLGGTAEYLAYFGIGEPNRVELDVLCMLWIYWVPPEEQETAEVDSSLPDVSDEMQSGSMTAMTDLVEGTMWLSASMDMIPDEARPVKGAIRCANAHDPVIKLDGKSLGPYDMRRRVAAVGLPRTCLLSSVALDLEPPEGYAYRPKEPCPLSEQQSQNGDCELSNLMSMPICVGFVKRVA